MPPDRLSIFVADGLRHRQLSGYGMLARKLALGLCDRGHDVWLRASERPWEEVERGARERLGALAQVEREDRDRADLVLQIRSPPKCGAFARPSLIYTQNALGGLPPQWITALRQADGIVVPSEYDRRVFARHFARVYVAHQSSDPEIFRPLAREGAPAVCAPDASPAPALRPRELPRRRDDGAPDHFVFQYVGSYSFRKGVDLLLEAFLAEFSPEEPVELRLRCPGAERADQREHLREAIERASPAAHVPPRTRAHRTRPTARVRLSSAVLAPEAMCRLYNDADCVITLSRGEGWCMPLTEALLCEAPVIAPRSTAMGEYLDESIAELLPTRELPAQDAHSRFAGTFASVYGHPGITYAEPDVRVARATMRRVYEDPAAARAKARAGRARIRGRWSWGSTARELERACFALLAESAPTR